MENALDNVWQVAIGNAIHYAKMYARAVAVIYAIILVGVVVTIVHI